MQPSAPVCNTINKLHIYFHLLLSNVLPPMMPPVIMGRCPMWQGAPLAKLSANHTSTPAHQRDAVRDDYCGTDSGAILMVSTHGSGLTP